MSPITTCPPDTLALLARSWAQAWHGLGGRGDGTALRDALCAAYAEPQRHYHTRQHLAESLALFETQRALAADAPAVEMALWFHDAVYDPQAADNEARSADWAAQALTAAGVAAARAAAVTALVLATRHDAPPDTADAALLVDVDLAILGAAPARFDEYERQVRAEYAFVPEAQFRARRRALLEALRARPVLYTTPALRDRFEAPARANLAASIARL